jgi:hypothetical protein
MSDKELYQFLMNGGSFKQLAELAYKKGYDKCHSDAMKYLIRENR